MKMMRMYFTGFVEVDSVVMNVGEVKSWLKERATIKVTNEELPMGVDAIAIEIDWDSLSPRPSGEQNRTSKKISR